MYCDLNGKFLEFKYLTSYNLLAHPTLPTKNDFIIIIIENKIIVKKKKIFYDLIIFLLLY